MGQRFNAPWSDYRTGFGSPIGNFWLGLEKLHQMTSSGKWKLKIRVKWDKDYVLSGKGWERVLRADSRAGRFGESEWEDFRVGSEATNYQLGIGNQLSKNNWEGDPFHSHDLNGMQFSTRDRDNDRSSYDCASWGNG